MDPGMLRDILDLDERPVLRPALVTGYDCKLWGQYPALLNAEQEMLERSVAGVVYHVRTEEDAKKLAGYETGNYRPQSCSVSYMDGSEPATDEGYLFVFVGDRRRLTEGKFDLDVWLKRVGRKVDSGK